MVTGRFNKKLYNAAFIGQSNCISLLSSTTVLDKCNIFGQGNLNMVSEKSGKSQGILLSIICGNPV